MEESWKKYTKGRREELKLVSCASAIIYVLDPDTEPTQTEEKRSKAIMIMAALTNKVYNPLPF